MYQADPANTGANDTEPATRGTKEWQSSGGGATSPAVVNDTVYVGLSALNVDSGTERWTYTGTEGIAVPFSPAVVDDTVYLSTFSNPPGDYADSGTVVAAATDDGTKRWDWQINSQIETSPAVSDEYIHVGSNGTIYALDRNAGTKQWQFQTGDPIVSTPAVSNGRVYVGNTTAVYALTVRDGSEQWQFQTEDSVAAPAVDDNTVYIGSGDGNVYALDRDGGTEQWRFEFETKGGFTSPAVTDETVYFGGDNTVYAVDKKRGTENWRFQTDSQPSSPSVVKDSLVYVGTGLPGENSGSMYALTSDTGTEKWRFKLDKWFERASSPAVVDGTVYFGTRYFAGKTPHPYSRVLAIA